MNQEFNTPMMKQYLSIKKRYAEYLLLYRMGDFYELFLEDAIVGAKVLGITLTSRSKGKDGRIPMAGVPYHAVDTYLHRLVKAGYKVAICEQLSEPNSKGIVERDVIRIVTPGTIVDETALDQKKNNFIIALCTHKNLVAISCADLSTGEFMTEEIQTTQIDQTIVNELMRLHPAECIISESDYQNTELLKLLSAERKMSITSISNWETRKETVRTSLQKRFGVSTLAAFAIEDNFFSQQVCLALYEYLFDTQKGKIPHIRSIQWMHPNDALILDRSTILNLELFSTIREHDTTGSLLQSIDHTQTAMGARLLKSWISSPLREHDEIARRHEAVSFLLDHEERRENLREQLSEITDIERLISRLSIGIGNARDLVNLRFALEKVQGIREVLSIHPPSFLADACTHIESQLHAVSTIIANTLVDHPAITIKDGNLVRKGVDSKLDELRELVDHGDQWLQKFEERQRLLTQIPTLKVRYNSVFGYYIEITKSHLHHVPSTYIRRQTLVNCERYSTPELKERETQILSAKEEANRLEYELYSHLLTQTLEYSPVILQACSAIASIDCIAGFAHLARTRDYVRPKLLFSNELHIEDGRHPVVEQLLGDEPFVPNSIQCDSLKRQLLIITGPNMAGKSVLIRQTALIVLLCQMGCFVPAKKAHIGIVDRIFVRSGASDVITSGLSTFMVEMVETAHILTHATEKSLIIMDEIGRGTSTYDGISIAWAVASYLVTTTKAKTLFATHYHELQALEELHPTRIHNYHMAVQEHPNGPLFLHTLLPGGATSSFGIDVAKLAGVPLAVIEAAQEKLKELEHRNHSHSDPRENSTLQKSTALEESLRTIQISHLTPLEALNKLASLQREATDITL